MSFLDAIDPPRAPRPPAGPMTLPSDKYAKAALDGEIEKVESAPEGTRNHQLFASCAALCELRNSGALTEDTVRSAMTEAARNVGLDEIEIERTIQSAFDKTEGVVRMVPERSPVSIPSGDVNVAPRAAETAGIKPSNPSQLRSRLLTPKDLRELPEPSPLIEGVLDRGTTAILFAAHGSGKSFIALDWACCIATGEKWMGKYVDKAKVLYVVAEGAYGFAKRIEAWETARGTSIEDGMMGFLPIAVNMMTEDVDTLIGEIKEGGYELVVLDTLARCTVGADENSSRDIGIVIDSMTRLVDATLDHRGVVLGIHHAGRNGNLRGSSAYEAGVDTVYRAEKSATTINLQCTKRKDGPDDDKYQLHLIPVDGTDSCVVEGFTGTDVDITEAAETLKKIFTTMFAETGASKSDLLSVATEMGMTSSELFEGRQRLIATEWLTNVGTGARPLWKIAMRGEWSN